MPNRRETTITNELVNILRNMHHEWKPETEVNTFIKGRKSFKGFDTDIAMWFPIYILKSSESCNEY